MVRAMRHDRIIDLLGGNTTLGRLLDRSDSAISRWRTNGIPPNFWPRIVRLAAKLDVDVTFDKLAAGPPSDRSVTDRGKSRGRTAERVA